MIENRAETHWGTDILTRINNCNKDGWHVVAVSSFKAGVNPMWLLVLEREV